MKLRHSLTLRLTLCVFAIIALANIMTGALYFVFSAQRDHVLVKVFTLMNSPIQLLLVSLILATLISATFSRALLRPLRQLSDATKKVAKGDFSVRVDTAPSESEISELLGSFNDMTRELGSNEIFKKDFINNFSHEFKTPIVSIRGFARQLQRNDLTDAQRREYVDIIVRESERLSTMSGNILLLTRLENEEIMPDRCEYMLDEQLRQALLLMEKQWSDKEMELDIDLPDLRVCANEEMLSHVWINLIGNAVKFSRKGGRLTVHCARTGAMASVIIADTGIGMDEATCARIFDKFYQGDITASGRPAHSIEGNGLGLALAKRIVELSGGSISVKSAPDEGSEFTVKIPVGI